MIDYGQEQGLKPTADQLKRISHLCRQERKLAAAVAVAQETLKRAQLEYDKLTKDLLPNMIKEAGFTEIKLDDGWSVRVEDDLRASITEENRAEAHKWLRAHGFASVIKDNVIVTFGMGEEKVAAKLYKELAKKYEAVKFDERVHPSTLRSLVSEILAGNTKEKGKPLSLPECISYVSLPVAKIKEPKAYETRKQNADPF